LQLSVSSFPTQEVVFRSSYGKARSTVKYNVHNAAKKQKQKKTTNTTAMLTTTRVAVSSKAIRYTILEVPRPPGDIILWLEKQYLTLGRIYRTFCMGFVTAESVNE